MNVFFSNVHADKYYVKTRLSNVSEAFHHSALLSNSIHSTAMASDKTQDKITVSDVFSVLLINPVSDSPSCLCMFLLEM